MTRRVRGRRSLIAMVFVATVVATTAAHCDQPPPPVAPTATLELLNGPVVTAGDTLRFRVGINDGVAPENWALFFRALPYGGFVQWYEFPDGECGALHETLHPVTDPSVEFSAEVECVLPAYVASSTWQVDLIFDRGNSSRMGPPLLFEVTGGIDDWNGPTVEFTEFPTQPVVAGQSFEVAARITDPNGIALTDSSLDFTYGPGPRPQCQRITAVPHPSFDIEVRYRCDTTTGSAGSYSATLAAFDLMWRSGQSPTTTVTII